MNNLIIVTPAYNEEGCILAFVEKWLSVAHQVPSTRLLVINDGSKDRTGDILDQLSAKHPALHVIHQENSGYGPTVLRAYREAIQMGTEWIFQVDSDDQQEPQDFWKLWEHRDESPFILGFRHQRDEPAYRHFISYSTRFLGWILFGVWIKDLNIPFRLMKSSFLSSLLPLVNPDVFAPNVCLSLLARRKGAQTLDIPVAHYGRHSGVPHVQSWKWIKVTSRCAWELIQLRLHTLA